MCINKVIMNKINNIFDKLLFDYIRDNKLLVLIYISIVLFTFPAQSVILPQFYSKLFESIKNTSSKSKNVINNFFESIKKKNTIGLIYIVILIWIGIIIFYAIKNSFEAKIVPDYLSFVRGIIFEKTIEKHKNNYEDIRVGEHITRILDVSRNMRDSLSWGMSEILPIMLAMLCIISYFFYVNKYVGLLMLAGFTITGIIIYCLGKKCINVAAKREAYYLLMSEKFHDSFGNLMNIYLNNSDKQEIKSNHDIEKKHTELYKEQLIVTRNTIIILCVLSVATFIGVVLLMYNFLKKNVISKQAFISVWIILIYYIGYLIQMSMELPHFLTRLGNIKNSAEFLNSILESSGGTKMKDTITNGSIEFKNVNFRYPRNEEYVLNNFNLTIDGEEKLGILGTSGSGKTTAMKLLLGMYPIESGSIIIDGVDISTIDENYLRKEVNYVNQRTALFNDTVLNNIKYGHENLSTEEVLELLNHYQLDTVYSKLKEGVNTNAGVHGGNLSLGMQKVTMLLRGLFRDSKIIILDEPLAGLDANTRTKIMNVIKDKCNGKTLIVITHDKEIIPHMDRVENLTGPPKLTNV